ncbi:MAG: bifunctional riboflavin kinase/FAD synthetase [Bacilli bacterium]|nr:bifunctional riboflavin kinase/FAD synthetase [Bacilli bacterium]
MEIIEFDIHNLPAKKQGLALALGTFDGFHQGHQRLLIETKLNSKSHSGALLFTKSPREVVFGEEPTCIMGLSDKIRFLNKMGIDYAYVVKADEEFYGLSKEEFIEGVLKPLGAELLVVGADYRYGKKGAGDPDFLSSRIDTIVVPLLMEEGEKISSTLIRDLIKNGEVAKAGRLLGHPYEMHGKVKHGFQNGRKIGYPTANIDLDYPYLLPKSGVYFALAYVHGMPHRAIVNVGMNPTVGKITEPRVEAHILDFDNDIYGKTVYLEFIDFHRDESKFASLEELAEILKGDEAWARSIKEQNI